MTHPNSILRPKSFACSVVLLAIALTAASESKAQNFGGRFGRPTNLTVQQPVIGFFNVRTTVMVPDGGTMSLGGVSRHSEGRISRGTPGLGGHLFQNRGTGYSSGGSRATVKATIISNQEIGDALMAEGERRYRLRQRHDPNGSAAVQAKADFISRNIGRSRK